jgi:hypothetical protein
MNSITNLSPTQLRKAANIQEKIQDLQKELSQILGAKVEAAPTEAPRKKRKMSAAGRRAIGAAAKARWAKFNAVKGKPAKKAKRKMSAQGLANIRAGVAKRMAAQGKAAKPAKKAKRKMTAAWKAALAKAWEARRAKAAGKS